RIDLFDPRDVGLDRLNGAQFASRGQLGQAVCRKLPQHTVSHMKPASRFARNRHLSWTNERSQDRHSGTKNCRRSGFITIQACPISKLGIHLIHRVEPQIWSTVNFSLDYLLQPSKRAIPEPTGSSKPAGQSASGIAMWHLICRWLPHVRRAPPPPPADA